MIVAQHPNQVVQQLTGRDYLSYSAITTFQQCPLKWHFRYVLGLPEEKVSSSLVFGGAIHRAVEFHFQSLLEGDTAPGIDALLREYQAAWQERDLNVIRFSRGEDVDSLNGLAERVLAAFQASELATPIGKIIGVEEELRGQIFSGCPEFLARIDLIVDDGDELQLVDLKTARSRWSAQQADDAGEQLVLYAALAKDLMPGKPLRLEFAVVTKTKVPAVEVLPVAVDATRIARTRSVVERTWQAMESGHVYPAPSAMNCSGCGYRERCRVWSG